MSAKAAREASRIYALILAVIASFVAALLYLGKSPWGLIVLYWLTLTGKNILDYFAQGEEEKEHDDQ